MYSYPFSDRYRQLRKCSETYYITVIVDTNLDTIIGAGTLVNIKHRKKVTNKKEKNKGHSTKT